MSNPSTATSAESKKQADTHPPQQQKKPPVLEEDDEFEDFPVEDMSIMTIHHSSPALDVWLSQNSRKSVAWKRPSLQKGCRHLSNRYVPQNTDWPQEDAELPGPSSNSNGSSSDHLWEESWDDQDINEDFSKQLKYVLPLLFIVTFAMGYGMWEIPTEQILIFLWAPRREELKKVEAAKQ